MLLNTFTPDSLGRSGSNASSQPAASVVRNTSTATTSTFDSGRSSSLYGDPDTMLAPSSSAATTIDRGNSVGSYASRSTSNGWAPPPPAKNNSSTDTYLQPQPGPSQAPAVASSSRSWKDNDIIRTLQDIKRPLQLHEGYDEDEFYDDDDPSEEGDDRFFNPALLSHIAVRLRDKVPRGTHVKGSIPYERAFTGKDIVVSWFTAIF